MKQTIKTWQSMKEKKEKIAMVTAYDYSIASMVNQCGVHGILVGDSLGMVCLGYRDTLQVTLDDILYHTKSVKRSDPKALLVSDMPFMSYHTSVYDAVKNAGRLIQEAGAEAIKLEGGIRVLSKVKAIVEAQIPVMGHIGLTPQSVNLLGGYKVQGKLEESAKQILEDAKRLEDAGVFSIVLECVPAKLASFISSQLTVPTIGIGAGPGCDGQILVFHDLLNIQDGPKKKFVSIFADAGECIRNGLTEYVHRVGAGDFPAEENSFAMDDTVLEKLYG